MRGLVRLFAGGTAVTAMLSGRDGLCPRTGGQAARAPSGECACVSYSVSGLVREKQHVICPWWPGIIGRMPIPR